MDRASVRAFAGHTAYIVAGTAVRQKEVGIDLESSFLGPAGPHS